MAGSGLSEAPAATERGARWRLRDRVLSLERPAVVGVLNVTPDSFSDPGRYLDPGAAAERARALVDEGADVVDVGAESTRPGADPVPADEEWGRLEPVLARLGDLPAPISVDTTKSEVARRALEAGAAAINDVSGLRFDPAIASLAAETGAGLVLMHMRGDPRTMQRDTRYDDLIGEVREALARSRDAALAAGCSPDQVVLDPGIGFGKSAEGNLELLARLDALLELGRPLLVGPSRKSFIGAILEVSPEERLEGTLAACALALARGARLFRVHDARATRRALDVAEAILRAGSPGPGVASGGGDAARDLGGGAVRGRGGSALEVEGARGRGG